MRCTMCGAPGPLWGVTYRRNIGFVAAHRSETSPMQACKPCLHKEYWKRFAVLVTVGWTSYHSLVIGPVFLILNTVGYLRGLIGKPSALPPQEDGLARQRLPPG